MKAREWVWAPALIAAGMLGPGLAAAPHAQASPVDTYVIDNAAVICEAVAQRPYLSTIDVIVAAIVADTGWATGDAATVLGKAIYQHCPWNRGVVERYVRTYAPERRGMAV